MYAMLNAIREKRDAFAAVRVELALKHERRRVRQERRQLVRQLDAGVLPVPPPAPDPIAPPAVPHPAQPAPPQAPQAGPEPELTEAEVCAAAQADVVAHWAVWTPAPPRSGKAMFTCGQPHCGRSFQKGQMGAHMTFRPGVDCRNRICCLGHPWRANPPAHWPQPE